MLGEPVLARLFRRPYAGLACARPFLVAGAAGIAADWILKTALAPTWGLWLRHVLP